MLEKAKLFSYNCQKSCFTVSDAALSVGICGVEVYRIALIEDYLLILEYHGNSAFKDEVEFLTCMCDQLSGLIGRLKCDQEGLHDLIRIAESQILEAIALITADASALAAADDLEGVDTAGLTCDELVEIHAELICDLIDYAYWKITVCFIACILLCGKTKLLCKLLL